MKLHIISSRIQAVRPAGRTGEDLQGDRPFQFGVVLRRNLKYVVGAQVHDYEISAANKSNAIGSRRQRLTCKLEGHFGKQICLVLFADAR